MKRLTLLALFLLLPGTSFAAVTQDQALSLISVVQSSPGTPSSAFTNLITAFSNITVPQADSLIGVIQAAPGVAPDSFVSLLLAFTQDTAAVVAPTPDPVPQPAQSTEPVVGSSQPAPSEPVPPVVQQIPMDTESPQIDSLEIVYKDTNEAAADNGGPAGFYLIILANEPIDLAATDGVTVGRAYKSGIHDFPWRRTKNPAYYYEVKVTGVKKDDLVNVTIKDEAGNPFTRAVRVR